MNSRNIIVTLIGESGVGKSTYLKRVKDGEYSKCPPTITSAAIDFCVEGMDGEVMDVRVDVREMRDINEYKGQGDAVMIMYDPTHPNTFWRALDAVRKVMDINHYIPVVVVGSKQDVRKRKLLDDDIDYALSELYVRHASISSHTNFGIEDPFLYVIRDVLEREDISFTNKPSIAPPTVRVPNVNNVMNEMEDAYNTPFPDEYEVMEERTKQGEIVKCAGALYHFHTALQRVSMMAKL